MPSTPEEQHRWFAFFGVKPHNSKTFKLPAARTVINKVRNVTERYLDSPDHAVAPCADEKPEIQISDRTQLALLIGLGYSAGHTKDYARNGPIRGFLAVFVAVGTGGRTVWAATQPRRLTRSMYGRKLKNGERSLIPLQRARNIPRSHLTWAGVYSHHEEFQQDFKCPSLWGNSQHRSLTSKGS